MCENITFNPKTKSHKYCYWRIIHTEEIHGAFEVGSEYLLQNIYVILYVLELCIKRD